MVLKVGDKVLFTKHIGIIVEIKENNYFETEYMVQFDSPGCPFNYWVFPSGSLKKINYRGTKLGKILYGNKN